MAAFVRFNDLKFPLKMYVELRVWGENWFRIPFNYLVDGEIYALGKDSAGIGARINIVDPEIGEVSKQLNAIALSKNADNNITDPEITLRWGWIDNNGKQYLVPRPWKLVLTKLDVRLNAMGASYDLEFISPGMGPLLTTTIDADLKKGTNNKTPLEVIKQLIKNYNLYNSAVPIKIVPNIDDLIKKEKTNKNESYNGDSQSLLEALQNLCKSTEVDVEWAGFDKTPNLLLYDNPDGKGFVVELFFDNKDKSLKPLDCMYPEAIYHHRQSSDQNILEFNLNVENWLGIFGTNKLLAGATDKRTGEEKLVEGEEKPASKKIVIKSPTETGMLDNDSTPVQVEKWLRNTSFKFNEMVVTGDITVVGDPNLYDPSIVGKKYIYLLCKNKFNLYTGKYVVTGFKHNFGSGRWTTVITIKLSNENINANNEKADELVKLGIDKKLASKMAKNKNVTIE